MPTRMCAGRCSESAIWRPRHRRHGATERAARRSVLGARNAGDVAPDARDGWEIGAAGHFEERPRRPAVDRHLGAAESGAVALHQRNVTAQVFASVRPGAGRCSTAIPQPRRFCGCTTAREMPARSVRPHAELEIGSAGETPTRRHETTIERHIGDASGADRDGVPAGGLRAPDQNRMSERMRPTVSKPIRS